MAAASWLPVIIGGILAAQTMVLSLAVSLTPPGTTGGRLSADAALLALAGAALAMLGWPVLRDAIAAARARRLAMEQLFLAALSAAFIVSARSLWQGVGPVYFDVVAALLVVYALGRTLNGRFRQRAMDAGDSLRQMAAHARRFTASGGDESIDAGAIAIGDVVRVLPGEIVPIDGVVTRGQAFVARMPFTGEWVASAVKPGDAVQAGGACEDGELLIRATVPGHARQLDTMANRVADACATPSPLQRRADRWTAAFLPFVAMMAIATASYWSFVRHDANAGIMNALAVLLVACPCAAGLAVPLALWRAAAACAARGLVFRRGGEGVERLAGVTQAIFDKTGTLADERLTIVAAKYEAGWDPAAVHQLVAAAEAGLTHPVARALAMLDRSGEPVAERIALRTLPGRGIEATILPLPVPRDRTGARMASADEMDDKTKAPSPLSFPGLLGRGMSVRVVREGVEIAVSMDGQPAATFGLAESLQASAERAIEQLRVMGLPCSVLTGDGSASAAAGLAVPVSWGVLPAAKHAAVVATHDALFVGDGANDAAALAAARLGVAMAGGSPAALAAAGALLHGGDLTILPWAIGMCRRAVTTARSSLWLATGYNLGGITLAASGQLHPVLAAILMCASSSTVAWRASREPADVITNSRTRLAERRPARWLLAIAAGLQLATIALVAGNAGFVAAICGIVGTAGVWSSLRNRSLGETAAMFIGMATLGGLGMAIGTWADANFHPLVVARSCCVADVGWLVRLEHAATSWMTIGMLALGVPAMAWAACCGWRLAAHAAGMAVGMIAGGAAFAAIAPHGVAITAWGGHAFMLAGMLMGMAAVEAAWQVDESQPRRAHQQIVQPSAIAH